jgi:riboflavin kinase/FMN adenylyltransferase
MMAGPGGRLLGFAGGGTAVTVGTFDGVHRGHLEVLKQLCGTAERSGLPSVLVTFDPHPLSVVRPESAPPLLTTRAEKVEVLAETGVNYVVILRFDRSLADYSPRRFVEEILIGRLGMRHLVIGYDHGFGRGRSGDVETLQDIGSELGYDVDVVGPVGDGAQAVSSTRIRRMLEEGDVTGAARGLGRAYSMRGCVVRGDGRGRQLGFPTANLKLDNGVKLVPRPGIYAVRAAVGQRQWDGVLHLGPRPTFPGATPSIELHVPGLRDDLYGQEVEVWFCARLRDVVKFDSEEALVRAMAEDVERAKVVMRSGASACAGSGKDVTVNG